MFYGEALESRIAASQTTRNMAINPPDKFPDELIAVAQVQADALSGCTPFWWSRSIAESVLHASENYPVDIVLSRDLLYMDEGWYFFDSTLLSVSSQDEPFNIKYLSWIVGRNNKKVVLLVSAYCEINEVPVLFGYSMMNLGESIEQQLTHQKSYGQRLIKFVLASSAWLRQQILVTHDERPNHHTRKIIKRERGNIDIPNIRVIQLRRAAPTPHDSASVSDRDYHCQWMVRGHWRNQYYASSGDHMPKYIHPYIKGPEDKPLKPPSGEIFAVVR